VDFDLLYICMFNDQEPDEKLVQKYFCVVKVTLYEVMKRRKKTCLKLQA